MGIAILLNTMGSVILYCVIFKSLAVQKAIIISINFNLIRHSVCLQLKLENGQRESVSSWTKEKDTYELMFFFCNGFLS